MITEISYYFDYINCYKLKPHFIMGFNSDNYDWEWIIKGALRYEIPRSFNYKRYWKNIQNI